MADDKDIRDLTAEDIFGGKISIPEPKKKRNWKEIAFGKGANISPKFFVSKEFLYPLICIFLIITVMEVGQMTSLMIVQQIKDKCGSDVIIDSASGLTGVAWHHETNTSVFNITVPS